MVLTLKKKEREKERQTDLDLSTCCSVLIIGIKTQVSWPSVQHLRQKSTPLFKLFRISNILMLVGQQKVIVWLHTQLYKKCYIELVSMATITSYPRFSGLREQSPIVSQFCRSQVWASFSAWSHRLKSKGWQNAAPRGCRTKGITSRGLSLVLACGPLHLRARKTCPFLLMLGL